MKKRAPLIITGKRHKMGMFLFYIATLGCKVNQYESQALREAWISAGLVETSDPRLADVVVVNSCAVTSRAVSDTRHTARRLHRAAPGAAIVITGCAAAPQAEEFAALPGVLHVVAQADKTKLKRLLPELSVAATSPEGKKGAGATLFAMPGGGALKKQSPAGVQDSARPVYPDLTVCGSERSRAVLKIQDGCSHGCAYCIVPLTRGVARSRPFAESLAEARRLFEAGFAEIVISGVNLRQYRHDNGGDFWDLLLELDAALAPEWAGRARFRLSSLEPGQLEAGAALDTVARCCMVAPHLHISLQSGSHSVLRSMGRGHYDLARLPDFLAALRNIWPRFGLGADLLTGFPGESEAEFAEGLAFVRELGLSYAHVFPYSERPGTKAATLPGQIAHKIKKERAALLRAALLPDKESFLSDISALPELSVVFEYGEGSQRKAQGICEYYACCRLEALPSAAAFQGLVRVRPLGVRGEDIMVAELPESK